MAHVPGSPAVRPFPLLGGPALALATLAALAHPTSGIAQTGGAQPAAAAAAAPSPQVAAPWWQNPATVTAALASVLSLATTTVALGFGHWNTRLTIRASRATSEASTNQKANDSELAAIQARLDGFYGPYLQRSEENRLLADELRSRRPKGFRTLLSLIEPGWLDAQPKADRTLIDEIVGNGAELRTMIRKRAGEVDASISPYLARAGTHFTVLALARAAALGDDPERFRRFVYPRQLDPVLRLDMARLRARAALLRSSLLVQHPASPGLEIPAELALEPWEPGEEGAAIEGDMAT